MRRRSANSWSRRGAAVPQVGADLAGGQYVLREAGDFRAGVSGVAGEGFPSVGLRAVVADGQFSLTFEGLWTETTMWEIYALSTVERAEDAGEPEAAERVRAGRAVCAGEDAAVGEDGAAAGRAGAERQRLWDAAAAQLSVAGVCGEGDDAMCWAGALRARRIRIWRTSTIWKRSAPTRTSCRWRWRRWRTNDEELKTAQYRLLELWQQTYQGELLIMLPDTFGTTQFLQNAPDWVADWTGQRVGQQGSVCGRATNILRGSKSVGAIRGRSCSLRPTRWMWTRFLGLHAYFAGRIREGAIRWRTFGSASDFMDERKWMPERRIRFSAGWGTLLTNDFRDCNPLGDECFDPVSLVCKLNDADGRPAVKLSDNFQKALGPPEQIERYRRVFGLAGIANAPVIA